MPRLAAKGSVTSSGPQFLKALRFVAGFQAALLVPWLVLIAPNPTLIFGEGFAKSSDVLHAITPYFFLAGIAPLASLATIYAGGERRRIVPSVCALALNAGLTAVLLGPLGIVAGAIGIDVGSAVYVVLFLSLCGRLMAIPGRTLFRTVAVPLGCGVVTAASAVAVSTLGPLAAVLVVVPAVGLHIALLRVTHMLSSDELAQGMRLARHPLSVAGNLGRR